MVVPFYMSDDPSCKPATPYTALLRIIALGGEWIADHEISIDSAGNYTFNFASLPEGIYDLHVYLAGIPLHAQRVDVRC